LVIVYVEMDAKYIPATVMMNGNTILVQNTNLCLKITVPIGYEKVELSHLISRKLGFHCKCENLQANTADVYFETEEDKNFFATCAAQRLLGKIQVLLPRSEEGVKKNPTRMISIINATKEKDPQDTGVLWLITRKKDKNVDIQFIAINWYKFYRYYKRDQHQPHILDRTIREKFQPSKCKRDRKDPNSSEWREVDRKVTIEFNLTPPQKGYDTVYTFVPWWTDNGIDPPAKKGNGPGNGASIPDQHASPGPNHSGGRRP